MGLFFQIKDYIGCCIILCVSFVKKHDRVFNLGPADGCFATDID